MHTYFGALNAFPSQFCRVKRLCKIFLARASLSSIDAIKRSGTREKEKSTAFLERVERVERVERDPEVEQRREGAKGGVKREEERTRGDGVKKREARCMQPQQRYSRGNE